MFRRRTKQSFFTRLLNILWPEFGWKNVIRYWLLRVSRIPDSRHSISAGFAFGAAISFTPFVGFHFVIAAILAWLFRVNVIASAIGTAVGNPWTFPFIWIWIYKLGFWMNGDGLPDETKSIKFVNLFGNIFNAVINFDFEHVVDSSWPIIFPMLMGSVPTCVIAWLVFYFIIKYLLKSPKKQLNS